MSTATNSAKCEPGEKRPNVPIEMRLLRGRDISDVGKKRTKKFVIVVGHMKTSDWLRDGYVSITEMRK